LPEAPTAADWRAVPHGALLQSIYSRKARKAGDFFEVRVGALAETALVVACVAADASSFERLQFAGKLARAALQAEPRSILLWSQGLPPGAAAAGLLALVAAVLAAAFPLQNFKSKPKPTARLESVELAVGGPGPSLVDADTLATVLATAAGNNLARWLTALPPNVLDAAGYVRLLRAFARKLGLSLRFFGEAELGRMGAGAFLAVSRGNARRDAGIVHLAYAPGARTGRRGAAEARHRPARGAGPDLALVGKGICFDTGGTNLKPHKSMLDMHTDMEGSAVAVGSLYAMSLLRSPLRIDCWLAITENRIGPAATIPQDVVRAYNGTTIQIIHTDAEGRLVLADALALAAARRPRAIIDYATLTGACVYALTERYSGAFTNRPADRAVIEAAGAASGERVWCFPMDADFDADLDSASADVLQCAVDGKGDHILAARFLNRFVPPGIPWLHLDLAAGTRAGGLADIGTDITGFGVRYTVELVARGWPDEARRR
jgi:leucyl aminopeptidase